jgi:hypothetical protein
MYAIWRVSVGLEIGSMAELSCLIGPDWPSRFTIAAAFPAASLEVPSIANGIANKAPTIATIAAIALDSSGHVLHSPPSKKKPRVQISHLKMEWKNSCET